MYIRVYCTVYYPVREYMAKYTYHHHHPLLAQKEDLQSTRHGLEADTRSNTKFIVRNDKRGGGTILTNAEIAMCAIIKLSTGT